MNIQESKLESIMAIIKIKRLVWLLLAQVLFFAFIQSLSFFLNSYFALKVVLFCLGVLLFSVINLRFFVQTRVMQIRSVMIFSIITLIFWELSKFLFYKYGLLPKYMEVPAISAFFSFVFIGFYAIILRFLANLNWIQNFFIDKNLEHLK